jgi:beta-glucosidase-like glycosyl hydrolase
MPRLTVLFFLLLLSACSQAAPPPAPPKGNWARDKWVDSVYNRLTEEERIGQLFMVAAYSGGPKLNVAEIEGLLKKHQIGGLIFMQGGPVRQANLTNHYQSLAQVPLLLAMDAEWGLGMRLDSVINMPRQMMLGAANDTQLAYALGAAVGFQCRVMGVHVNFAPVVDVNNNPGNPVINARSFGEDKKRVARLAAAYMRGMQDLNVMACAKHFPGHGDVDVDSHKDLPVINKSRAELDTLELYPFRELIKEGVQSVMVAHLEVPKLESEAHVPTTLSKNTVTNLLKNELGFKGLVFTDALNMQGVAKYFKAGEADYRAFIAGNDVLLFSQDVPTAIAKIKAAIASGKVSKADLAARVKKILTAKWDKGLNKVVPIQTAGLAENLNQYTARLNERVADAALTLVRDRERLLPLKSRSKVLYIAVNGDWGMAENLQREKASESSVFLGIPKGAATTAAEARMNSQQWDAIVVAVHDLSFSPGKSYGLDEATLSFLNKAANKKNVIVALMGNAYALKYVCSAGTMICGYEDNEWTNKALMNALNGGMQAKGVLPVTPPCLQ